MKNALDRLVQKLGDTWPDIPVWDVYDHAERMLAAQPIDEYDYYARRLYTIKRRIINDNRAVV